MYLRNWKEKKTKYFGISTILLIVAAIIQFITKELSWCFLLVYINWIISFFIYEIISNWKNNDNFVKASDIYNFLINTVFAVMYFTLLIGIKKVSINIFLISMLLLLLIVFGYSLTLFLFPKRKLRGIIVTYLFFAGVTVISFAVAYNVAGIYGTGVENVFENKTLQMKDYLYFSSSAFSSSAIGDFVPSDDFTRLIFQIEVYLAIIIHVIIITNLFRYLECESKNSKNLRSVQFAVRR